MKPTFMNYRQLLQPVKEVLFVLSVIFFIAISSISNTTVNFLIVKGALGILFYSLIIINKNDPISTHTIKELVSLKYFIILICIALLSLTYSSNLDYGFKKLLNLIFNIPILLILNYFFAKEYPLGKNVSIYTIGFIISISFIFVLILEPFDQSRLYTFEFSRWSHVIFSRIFSLLFFVTLIAFIQADNFKKQSVYSLFMILVLFQIYFANLRAATLGVAIFSILILAYAAGKKQLTISKSLLLVTAFAITILFIVYKPTSEYFDNRYMETAEVFSGNISEKSGIGARFTAYEKSIEIIIDNPILGTGFGGFKGYNNDKFLNWIKYPHNIFLEFQVELGLLGSVFFLFFLFKTFKTLYNFNIYILFVWLYTLWLALVAKDISSNLLVFIPIIFYGRPYETEKLKELLFPSKKERVLPSSSSEISEY
jgi:O-antigen ligase